MRRPNRIVLSGIASVAFLMLAASTAVADYGMGGQWYSNRGPTVNIPPGKFDFPCTERLGLTGIGRTVDPIPESKWVKAPCNRVNTKVRLTAGSPPPPDGTVRTGGLAQQAFSGLQMQGRVISSTKNTTDVVAIGAPFTVPPRVFQRQQLSVVPVPANPFVQQLDTSFLHTHPATTRTLNAGQTSLTQTRQTVGNPTTTRVMRQGAWMDQPGRAGASFDVTKRNAAYKLTRRVSYSQRTGGNAFGGTMQKLLAGEGNVWLVVSITGVGPAALKSFIGDPVTAGIRTQATGKGFSSTNRRVGEQRAIFVQYAIGERCDPPVPPTPVGCSLFEYVAGYAGRTPAPEPETTNTGFPWTTAHVSVFGALTQGGVFQTTTLTAVGGDTILANGARQVQMVAGGLGFRTTAQGSTAQTKLDVLTITLPEPGTTAMFAGAFALVGGLFAARRRLF
jgi:hypothetical protein